MKNISVLILDNNERFLATAKEYLSEQDFIRDIYITPSDTEALQIANDEKPNLILLDVLMPNRNGIDLIPYFRENSPESRIIMLTLWDMNEYRESARNAGADNFITKRAMTNTLLPVLKKEIEKISFQESANF